MQSGGPGVSDILPALNPTGTASASNAAASVKAADFTLLSVPTWPFAVVAGLVAWYLLRKKA